MKKRNSITFTGEVPEGFGYETWDLCITVSVTPEGILACAACSFPGPSLCCTETCVGRRMQSSLLYTPCCCRSSAHVCSVSVCLYNLTYNPHAHARALFLVTHRCSAAVQTAAACTGKQGSWAAVSRLVEWCSDTVYLELSVAGWRQRHTREKVGSCSVLCLPTPGNASLR